MNVSMPDLSIIAEHVCKYKYYFASTSILATGLYIFCRRKSSKKKQYPKDVVIIHQINRAPCSPNLSPFCLKLETYLRLAKIPYQSDFGFNKSSKGKVPWITYNGVDVADSQFCMEFLNKQFKVDLNSHLSEKQKALALAYRTMIETNLFFLLAYQLWVTDDCNKAIAVAVPEMNFVYRYLLKYFVKKEANSNGLGRHSQEEREAIGNDILTSIDTLIGSNKFTLGDKPSELDAVVFAFCSFAVHHLFDSSYQKHCLEHLPNIIRYIETMKQECYPDWDILCKGFPN